MSNSNSANVSKHLCKHFDVHAMMHAQILNTSLAKGHIITVMYTPNIEKLDDFFMCGLTLLQFDVLGVWQRDSHEDAEWSGGESLLHSPPRSRSSDCGCL